MPVLSTLGAAIANVYGFTSGLIKDQYFNLVSLLLPGNGTNGAQNNTFLDSSSNTFTITRNGNTTQGTFSPFSQTGWGNYFNGSSYLSSTSNAAFGMGSGDYTIECWLYITTTSTYDAIYSTTGTTSSDIQVQLNNRLLRVSSYTAQTVIANAGTEVSLNTWTHVAFCRSGTTLKLFKNGVEVGSGTDSTTWATGAIDIGRVFGSQLLTGYMSNLRVVKGTALYTSGFTPSTTPLTAISGTSLLTCQANRFRDASSNGFTITTSGSPSVVAFSPFAPTQSYSAAAVGGSGYFDGTGDYLNGPTNTATAFNLTGDFTIECWTYFNSVSTAYAGILNWSDSSGWNGFHLFNNAGTLGFEFLTGSGAAGQVSGGAVTTGQWYFLQIVRSGSAITFYKNGTSVATTTYASSQTSSSSFIKVGTDRAATNYITGYISGIRIVNGTALSSSVPTSPPTAITNTSLLLNFTNAGVVDATAKNVLETVGNAQISTGAAKFGTTSIYFDGNGDQLVFPSSPLHAFGTGDFTIEFWAYSLDSGSSLRGIIDTRPASAGPNGILLREDSGGFLVLTSNTNPVLTTTTGRTANVWQHIALVRASGTFKLYVNALFQTSATPASNDLNSQNLKISGFVDTAASPYAYYGYLSNFRITKFARYSGTSTSTANFTLPTAPFPVQ